MQGQGGDGTDETPEGAGVGEGGNQQQTPGFHLTVRSASAAPWPDAQERPRAGKQQIHLLGSGFTEHREWQGRVGSGPLHEE